MFSRKCTLSNRKILRDWGHTKFHVESYPTLDDFLGPLHPSATAFSVVKSRVFTAR